MQRSIVRAARAVWCGLLLAACTPVVLANQAPTIASTPTPVAVVDTEYVYAIAASDPDGDAITFDATSAPDGFVYNTVRKAFVWSPRTADLGDKAVTLRARDTYGLVTTQAFTLHVLTGFCPLYPITLPDALLATAAPGQLFAQVPRGTGAGNYGWLTWAGSPSEPTLAQSLLPPGDSYTYINPDLAGDHLLSVTDWAQGSPGNTNSSTVRQRMDALLEQDIVLPLWSKTRGQGNQFDYQVARFATVRLKAYQLTGHGWLSFEFRGFTRCYNHTPTAQALNLNTDEDVSLSIALLGADSDGDTLVYEALTTPQHGTLTGTAPALRYTPAANYVGEDGFDYRVGDGDAYSAVAHVRINVRAVNDPPQAFDATYFTDEDTAVATVPMTHDVDGDTLLIHVVDAPQHGSLRKV